jgi:hypothetical protein
MTSCAIADHMLAAARHLYEGGEITSHWLREKLGVSRATAKRYLSRIEFGLPVTVAEQPVGPEGHERVGRVIKLAARALYPMRRES